MREILVTGGAGYIGSHTTLSLLQAGFDVLVLDNLSNSSADSLSRVAKIAERSATFVQGDIRNSAIVRCWSDCSQSIRCVRYCTLPG